MELLKANPGKKFRYLEIADAIGMTGSCGLSNLKIVVWQLRKDVPEIVLERSTSGSGRPTSISWEEGRTMPEVDHEDKVWGVLYRADSSSDKDVGRDAATNEMTIKGPTRKMAGVIKALARHGVETVTVVLHGVTP